MTDVRTTSGRDLDAAMRAADLLAARHVEESIARALGTALAGHVCLTCGRGRNVCTCPDGPTLERPAPTGPSGAALADAWNDAYDEARDGGADTEAAVDYANRVHVDRARGDVPPELAEEAELSPCCGLPVLFVAGLCASCEEEAHRG